LRHANEVEPAEKRESEERPDDRDAVSPRERDGFEKGAQRSTPKEGGPEWQKADALGVCAAERN